MTIPWKTLKNGFSMPVLGLGTWMLGGGESRDCHDGGEAAEASLRAGLESGYRHIDTAEMYAAGFAEKLVGRAIQGFRREELFLTSKVWKTHLAYDAVLKAAEASLRRLETDYLDLYLIHQVAPEMPLSDTIRALNRLIDDGLVKHIGVSNFAVTRLKRAQQLSSHPLVANQVHYNLTVREAEVSGLTDYCRQQDVMLIAWRPLQKGMLSGAAAPLLTELAARYGKTPAQIALNWLVRQPNVVTISTMRSREHQQANLAALGWSLEAGDEQRLSREYPGQQPVSDAVPLS
ncbi:aldo/keto reductase [Victivallis sp. Marseille-Q1083]|uniref:aldo/keto reductase n=1 Tax=Victivallis sp. Marseille-Q1083 TaxID=2717288 RepID=UPI00158B3E4C|nr:aldo/keto reductase [Victivallis sp. Marseille-Q1083]